MSASWGGPGNLVPSSSPPTAQNDPETPRRMGFPTQPVRSRREGRCKGCARESQARTGGKSIQRLKSLPIERPRETQTWRAKGGHGAGDLRAGHRSAARGG